MRNPGGAGPAAQAWLAGVAVALSKGEDTFGLTGDAVTESAFGKGEVESTLTNVLPYARVHLIDRVAA